jgi:hypothetical protein
MKKFLVNVSLFLFLILIFLIIILSTIGIETNKFNNLISEKASQSKNIDLKLETIKFKIDLQELSLFLETRNPKINYKELAVPVENVKVYIDFLSLFKSDTKIKKTNFVMEEIDIAQLKKLSILIKPSNLKSFLNNKIKNGKMDSEIEIFLNEKGKLKNFIAKGKVKNLKAELFKDLNLSKTNLNFFADKNDVLIKNIFGNLEDIKISEGDVKLNFENGIKLNSNFSSLIDLNENLVSKYTRFLGKSKTLGKVDFITANLNNNIYIHLDSTYKIKDYKYSFSGKIEDIKLRLFKPIKNDLITEKIEKLFIKNFNMKTIFTPKKISYKGEGKYSFNDLDFYEINFINDINNDLINLKLDFNYGNSLELDFINYKKSHNSTANFSLNLEKNKETFIVNSLKYNEQDNLVEIDGLKLKKNEFFSFKKIRVLTSNNDFYIQNKDKISIQGSKFDATNLAKFFSERGENKFKKLNSDIEIDFKNIKVPLSENLQNFKLIGEINKGQFIKISSKGDFGGDNFLDISMKKDKTSNKKYLEIYSDLTRPLLTEYKFFNGLSGGKLFFTSIIDEEKSISKLKIESFKVVNAPGLIKLLSLADLGGLADLAEGDGLSFDELEINFQKNKNFLKINEMLALGPSISVLMEGYQDESGLTSLRGTLVPAKTLNKMISKIPVIGNIVIPKEVGEGLFGISFKMKGPIGNVKTTINPIRTLTPRFIQKIIDRNKQTK